MAHGGGLGSLGKEFLANISGSVVHCTKYGTGKKGKIVCRKYGKGAGRPNTRARKAAGVKRKYRFPKHLKRKVKRGSYAGATRHCSRWGKGKSGRKVCRAWGPTRKALKSYKGRSKGKVCYMRKLKSGKRKRICRSVGKRSGASKGKRRKAGRKGTMKGRSKGKSRKKGSKRGKTSAAQYAAMGMRT